jgi:hypothetical protein
MFLIFKGKAQKTFSQGFYVKQHMYYKSSPGNISRKDNFCNKQFSLVSILVENDHIMMNIDTPFPTGL